MGHGGAVCMLGECLWDGMVTVSTNGRMVRSMMEIGRETLEVVGVSTHGPTVANMLANGKRVTWMVRASLHGRMARPMTENASTRRNTDMECTRVWMEKCTLVRFATENSTEWGSFPFPMDESILWRACWEIACWMELALHDIEPKHSGG
jgi:hypothetical protein